MPKRISSIEGAEVGSVIALERGGSLTVGGFIESIVVTVGAGFVSVPMVVFVGG